ncbi:hypothetical protein [Haloarcula laminariae]|uniref:hypothetical protein n=1 Tax=Haloarcula laminariae TaxID=2961577 RepID=UPI00240705DA|nr:hypothetical protein [Halomicroarcula sp. FL173]
MMEETVIVCGQSAVIVDGAGQCPGCGLPVDGPSHGAGRGRGVLADGGQNTASTDPSKNYRGPHDGDVDLRRIFARGDVAEWDTALYELRELLHTLEDANLDNERERREAEEALFHELQEVDIHLRDAWDSRVNGGEGGE